MLSINLLGIKGESMLCLMLEILFGYICVRSFLDLRKSKLLPRATGPFKVLEKINDNAYKLELPADFGTVSPMFNIADLKPYFGEEDEIARGLLQFKKGSIMWTSHLLIQPLYLQLHTYKDLSQDLVPNNLTIR